MSGITSFQLHPSFVVSDIDVCGWRRRRHSVSLAYSTEDDRALSRTPTSETQEVRQTNAWY